MDYFHTVHFVLSAEAIQGDGRDGRSADVVGKRIPFLNGFVEMNLRGGIMTGFAQADPLRVGSFDQLYPVDTTSFTGPNGIALSPDEQYLYVGDASNKNVYRMTVNADGSAGTPSLFYGTITSVDGVAVDCAGNTYWASNSAGKVVVLSPAGTKVGEFDVKAGVTNLAFGGPDMKTLYITAERSIFTKVMNIPGFPY